MDMGWAGRDGYKERDRERLSESGHSDHLPLKDMGWRRRRGFIDCQQGMIQGGLAQRPVG